MKVYSLHRITDGKWEVVLHIRRDTDWQYAYEPRPDIRGLIDEHYDISIDQMARLLLTSVLHCEAVEVNTLSGQGMAIRKQDVETSA